MNYDLHIFNSKSRFEESDGDHLRADHHLRDQYFEGIVSSAYVISVKWPGVYNASQEIISYPAEPFMVAEVTEINGRPSLILYYNGDRPWAITA